jgi:hypothetical protein
MGYTWGDAIAMPITIENSTGLYPVKIFMILDFKDIIKYF